MPSEPSSERSVDSDVRSEGADGSGRHPGHRHVSAGPGRSSGSRCGCATRAGASSPTSSRWSATPAAVRPGRARQVSVLPGKEAELTIMFRPPVGASTPTGTLPFAVRAVSEVGSSSSAVAEGRLELAGAAGLQAWADATTAAGRWSATYRLEFANQGNAPAPLVRRPPTTRPRRCG